MRFALRLTTAVIFMSFFSGLAVTSCSALPSGEAGSGLAMAPMSDMPADVQHAPATVSEAYRFAAANAQVMQQIPCYCGCGDIGHKSNYACYVAGAEASGRLRYDPHALGCSVCVDITQDVMRLLRQGKRVAEIRTYIDTTYARYGPSNLP